ncbi:2-hydroxychromene-2-carboxylate isomerase [Marinicauda algicola]|uniref:2-hydroxychromene-2-carboxylate isomerase n=1 Tax=Marinicauda algicola TaxID=2029849 RepID=A0A4S2H000_9PROT|nr:DsbA family protein [Marinicauda algicola]TGY88860.1 2-hydroxychromene-2-carboxylate isomerase [Marinicauda algicola]
MSLTLDLFWSFRSPYSYLATPRLRTLQEAWDLDIRVRPVRPLILREDGFFESRGKMWLDYLLVDVVRLAEYLDLPIAPPNPDPVAVEPGAGKPAADQSRVINLTRLGVAASHRGCGLAFLDAVSRRIFSGEAWTQGDTLKTALAEEDIDLDALQGEVEANPARFDAEIAQNEADLIKAGHWGVPTLVFQGEPFFGQDRIDLCLWRMKQHGLEPRQAEES